MTDITSPPHAQEVVVHSRPKPAPAIISVTASVGLVLIGIIGVSGIAFLAYQERPQPEMLATIAVLAVREIVNVLQSYLRAEGQKKQSNGVEND